MSDQTELKIREIQKPRLALRPVRRQAAEYVELVNSIRKDGVLQPILVRPKDDGYELVDGWHRLEAGKEAGLSMIPVVIKEMSDREVLVTQVKCNSIRPVTNRFEYAKRLKLLMEEGYTLNQLSVLIDKSPEWIRDQLQLNRLDESLRSYMTNNEIPMKSALALSNLPAELQHKFIDDALKMPAKEFEARAKSALRDFKAYMIDRRQEEIKRGGLEPRLRGQAVLRKEAFDLERGRDIIERDELETAEEGWEACMAWLFRLDKDDIESRKKGEALKERDKIRYNNEEWRKVNQKILEKYLEKYSEKPNNVE
jgi:ParB family chromosome partitioning protein